MWRLRLSLAMATPTASEKIYAHSPEASRKVAGFRQLWSTKTPCGRLFSSMLHSELLNCRIASRRSVRSWFGKLLIAEVFSPDRNSCGSQTPKSILLDAPR